MKNLVNAVVASIAVLMFQGSIAASVMTFNGTVADEGSFYEVSIGETYSEAGYTMTNDSGLNFFIDNDYRSSLLAFDDDVYEFNSSTSSQATFTRDGGGSFDFNSVYLGSLDDDAELVFTGYFSGGGSISLAIDTVVGNHVFTPFAGFTGLSSLVVTAPDDGEYPVMDNFDFSERGVVPEPGALMIWSVFAATGLIVGKRRRA